MKTSRRLYKLLLLLAGLMSYGMAGAQDFKYEGLWYTVYDKQAKTVYTARGSRPDPSVEISGDVVFPETVWYNGEAYTLVGIEQDSFSCCSDLISIELPNTVLEIKPRAFNNCPSLSSVKLGDSVITIGAQAFYNCSSLSSVKLSDNLITIGEQAFRYCTQIEELVLPRTVVSVGFEAFPTPSYNDRALRKTAYPATINNPFRTNNSIAYPMDAVFEDGVIYSATKDRIYFVSLYKEGYFETPATVKLIGENAFEECAGVTGIFLPAIVEEIQSDAFKGCTALSRLDIEDLTSYLKICYGSRYSNPIYFTANLYLDGEEVTDLKIPESITELKDYALYGFKGMKTIEIPTSVTSIGKYALGCCTMLLTLEIPSSVTSLGENMIYQSNSLMHLTLPDKLKVVPANSFRDCEGKLEIIIPDSVEEIENNAFTSCSNIQSIKFGNSVRKIGKEAFYGAISLKTLILPESLQEIGQNAFDRLESLEELVIPNSVTTIGSFAFAYCSNLKSLEIGNSVAKIPPYCFHNCPKLESVTFGSHVKYIEYAFGSDERIFDIYLIPLTPPEPTTSRIFDPLVLNRSTLYVPEESYDLYANHSYWGQFYDIVPAKIGAVEDVEAGAEESFRVFNLQGLCLYRGATREQLDNLPAGIYIVNGKKTLIR